MKSKEESVSLHFHPGVLWSVIKASGLVPLTITFVVLYAACSLAVDASEPGIRSLGDAAWFLYAVVTTIGLGDYTCVTLGGRLATIVVSIYSVFYLALITGAVVSYCGEKMRARRNKSVAQFLDELEHLPELSHDELVDLSNRVKRMK